jgi:chromosome partitioning protein
MIIAVTNLKGGVGKTTISTNLAACFSLRGKTVCLIDTDLKQKSAFEWVQGRGENKPQISVLSVEESKLNEAAEAANKAYDIVIIDGTPQITEVTDRAIIAADILIIPLLPSIYDLRAFENFYERLEKISQRRSSSVNAHILFNRVNDKIKISKAVMEAIKDYEVPILQTQIASRAAYMETVAEGLGVVEGKDKKASDEFYRLTDEIERIIRKIK